MAQLTREQYIEKYGVDPDNVIAAEEGRGTSYGTTVKNYGTSILTDIATLPTDLAAFPGYVYAGGKSLYQSYANDEPFTEALARNIQVEGAQANIQNHLNDVATSWKQQQPNMTPEDVQGGIEAYKKSKRFEDFMTEQLSGTAYLAAKSKDTVRRLLGDERTEEERPWTESAAGIIGTSLLGAPAGIPAKIGAAAGRNVITNALINNPASRVAMRGAELLTPLTIPYTGANVAANAAAGIALDQGVRYLRGKETAFTPHDDDSPAIGALGAIGTAAGAAAAFVATVKGRSRSVLEDAMRSQTDRALAGMQSIDKRSPEQLRPGEASIVAGPEQELGPTSSLAGKPIRMAENQLMDQGAALNAAIRSERGAEPANYAEAVRTGNSGAVLRDRAEADANIAMDGVITALRRMPSDAERRSAELGAQYSSYAGHLDVMDELQQTKIADLQKKIQNLEGSTRSEHNLQRGKLQSDLAAAENDLVRLRTDADTHVRPMLPEVPLSKVRQFAEAFKRDMSPHMVRFKQAIKEWGDKMLDLEVAAGRMDKAHRDLFRNRNPYYVPAINDPLKGATGLTRMWRSVVYGLRRRQEEGVSGTGSAVLHESPIKELEKNIRPIPSAEELASGRFQETRVTTPLSPLSAMHMYSQAAYKDVAHTHMRNELITMAHTSKDGKPMQSQLMREGRMTYLRDDKGDMWHSAGSLDKPFIVNNINHPNVVAEWQGGQVRLWKFGDRAFAAMLRQDPVMLQGLMKALASSGKLMKFFTTGRGNPAFALKGAAYDLLIGILTRMPNRAFGPLSHAAIRFLPTGVSRHVVGRIPDVSAIPAVLYHTLRSFTDTLAYHTSKYVARGLAESNHAFAAIRAVVGPRVYEKMVNTAERVALRTDNIATISLMRQGAAKGVMNADNIDHVRGALSMVKDTIPLPLKRAWQFYSDIVDSIYLGPKRMFYTENYALLHKAHNGSIPPRELEKLIHETRAIGGDMSKIPASKGMQNLETAFPYLTQTKLGAYHLYRHFSSPETMTYMWPRLMLGMYAIGQSMYWRTYWNQESADHYWKRTSDTDRYRIASIPAPKMWEAWWNGENPNYDRSLYYNLTLPPDITGAVAFTAAMMQQFGILPSDVTPRPIISDMGRILIDSFTPAMPPLIQALMAQGGMKLDPQGADTRGGSLFRTFGSTFRAGPQSESLDNLGEVSTSTALMMSALFGAAGGFLSAGTNAMLHASKFYPDLGTNNQPRLRESKDFAAGLKAATNEIYNKATANIIDVPLVWQNSEKYKVATPDWQYMAENSTHIRSIVGMRDQLGKAAERQRAMQAQAGGITQQALQDETLIRIAQVIAAWQRPTGDLGKLRKEYRDLSGMNRSIQIQYNMPQSERQETSNLIIRKMQDNMRQQTLATKYLEQVISQRFGQELAPRLRGRSISVRSIDAMLRESFGAGAPPTVGGGEED